MTDISLKLEIRPDRPLKVEHLILLRIFNGVAQSNENSIYSEELKSLESLGHGPELTGIQLLRGMLPTIVGNWSRDSLIQVNQWFINNLAKGISVKSATQPEILPVFCNLSWDLFCLRLFANTFKNPGISIAIIAILQHGSDFHRSRVKACCWFSERDDCFVCAHVSAFFREASHL